MKKDEFSQYVIPPEDANNLWDDMVDLGWVDENGDLTLLSVESEAGLYTPEEAKKDEERLLSAFWREYSFVLRDEIVDVLEKEWEKREKN